jgi:Niemann-Pick C1 protein
MNRVHPLLSACPACMENFLNLFCTFTCSPDQSLFINVTEAKPSRTGKLAVTEAEYFVADEYGDGFYDSCKDVKVGSTNSYAMDFIGGGAKNASAFLKFLGDKKPFGSPFQIDFPREREVVPPMSLMHDRPKACNDTDERYRCTCVDCLAVCPALPDVSQSSSCHVGALPCVSFASILIYCLLLLFFVVALIAHVAWIRRAQRKSERVRLLQDTALSDDEDEGDVVRRPTDLDRPAKQYGLHSFLDRCFSRLGWLCATYPGITVGTSVVLVGLLSLGWLNFNVETNPARLWVSPTSAAAREKAYFDEHFGPFYRIEQAFLVNDTDPFGPAPVLDYETLQWWFDVEDRVRRVKSSRQGLTLDDVCFKPTDTACVVQSLTGYFSHDVAQLERNTWKDKIRKCAEQPVDCRPPSGQPIKKKLILGGWEDSGDVIDAKALIVTWVVENHDEGTAEEAKVIDWEQSLEDLFRTIQDEARQRGLRLSFSTEMSLEQELNQSANTDAKIIIISYIIMFLYASLALGSVTTILKALLRNPTAALVQSKFTLGVIGIVIVLMSVSASVGLFSAAGISVTLIIAEVIPFLVLAIGVDNLFLIVHEFERVSVSHPDYKIEDRIAKALGRMGPSILLSATAETITFALGVLVGMPAVRNFAAYAAGAVVINAVLQVTMFVSVLAWNQQRVEAHRIDCLPCITVKGFDENEPNNLSMPSGEESEGYLQQFIRKTYGPILLRRGVQATVLVVFLGLFAAGVALIPGMELGLDQRIAIPSSSYLIPYFDDMYAYFDAGPPVYFVTRGLNATKRRHQQELCARFSTCQSYSLTNVIEQERKRPEVSFIAEPAASWIDDFLLWLDPRLENCCRENGHTCFRDRVPPWNFTLYGMPEGEEFLGYLSKWLQAVPNEDCSLGGKAAYGTAISLDRKHTAVEASHFRTSHSPLRSQADFIDSYASARRIADDVSDKMNIDVFPYSKFYIFFDQYAYIVRLAVALLGSALALVWIITSIFLGSLQTGLVVALTVLMILVDIMGAMVVTGVSLNAVSLVNLVICVGIGVEFCAHIARAFTFPNYGVMEQAKATFRGKPARAWTALVNVGGSVFSGITVTKLLGVAVLAFTRSKIFEIYYFRIWLALILFAACHALIFLPVALSLFGGAGKMILPYHFALSLLVVIWLTLFRLR